MVGIVLVLVILCIILWKVHTKIKRLKLDNVVLINGGVKSGKTTLAVALAIKEYRKAYIIWFIKHIFKKHIEKPLLYSNIPLKAKYVPLTKELIERKKRFNYKSVVILSESSLVIDSMYFKDGLVNEEVSLFIKLFGHETRGGKLFIETQALNDNHYAIKRGISRYVWIHSLIKVIPFILVYRVREMAYTENSDNVTNVFNEDTENTIKYIFLSKRVWKKFDCYCYSYLTDNLDPLNNELDNSNNKDLKARYIVSFKEYKTIPKGVINNDKQEN